MKLSYKTLQSHIVEPLPDISEIKEMVIYHAFEVESVDEIDGDQVMDIKVLPDRAGDCNTEYGMAREIANLMKLTLQVQPEYSVPGTENATVDFTPADISKYLGYGVTLDQIQSVLDQFHYQYSMDGDTVHFVVPAWRTDLVNVQDMTEEIGRVLGYDKIPAILPELSGTQTQNSEFASILRKRDELLKAGYHEVITYTFRESGDFKMMKAVSDKNYLRTNLLDGLRIAYQENLNRLPVMPDMNPRIFEIGSVFFIPSEATQGGAQTHEEMHVAWIDETGEHEEKLEVTDGDYIFQGNQVDHPFTMWSIYPTMTRDIAVWIPNSESSEELIRIIKENGTELLQGEPKLFDQFTKDDRTSYGYRMVFQSFDRTLTIDEINQIMDIITAQAKEKGWEVR